MYPASCQSFGIPPDEESNRTEVGGASWTGTKLKRRSQFGTSCVLLPACVDLVDFLVLNNKKMKS